MTRQITNALSIPIVRYKTEIDVTHILSYAETTGYNVGDFSQSRNIHLQDLPRFKTVFAQIQRHIDDYHMLFQYQCDRIEVSIAWLNHTTAEQSHHPHTHPNSLISGVLYLTDTTPTYFDSPAVAARNGILVQSLMELNYASDAIAGDLILFPSWLEHYTLPGAERRTLSFNTMPRGIVNQNTLIEANYR